MVGLKGTRRGRCKWTTASSGISLFHAKRDRVHQCDVWEREGEGREISCQDGRWDRDDTALDRGE